MTLRVFRRLFIAGTALAVYSTAQAALPPGAAIEARPSDRVDGIIVKYRDVTSDVAKARNLGAELASKVGVGLTYKRPMARGGHVLTLDVPATRAGALYIARRIAKDPRVLYAEPDYRMFPMQTAVNDARYADQWHLWHVDASIVRDSRNGYVSLPNSGPGNSDAMLKFDNKSYRSTPEGNRGVERPNVVNPHICLFSGKSQIYRPCSN